MAWTIKSDPIQERTMHTLSDPCPIRAGDPTPWGPAQTVVGVRRGEVTIVRVTTASHGGYYVPDALLSRIPEAHQEYACYWSSSRNWYEEDCTWAYVALALPEMFSDQALADARVILTWLSDRGGK